jgi:hypothetical protein
MPAYAYIFPGKFNATSVFDCECYEGLTMQKIGEGDNADYACVPNVEDPCAANPCGPNSFCKRYYDPPSF